MWGVSGDPMPAASPWRLTTPPQALAPVPTAILSKVAQDSSWLVGWLSCESFGAPK